MLVKMIIIIMTNLRVEPTAYQLTTQKINELKKNNHDKSTPSINTMAVIMVAMLPMMMVLLVRGSSSRLPPSHQHRHSDDGDGGHDGDDGADDVDFG